MPELGDEDLGLRIIARGLNHHPEIQRNRGPIEGAHRPFPEEVRGVLCDVLVGLHAGMLPSTPVADDDKGTDAPADPKGSGTDDDGSPDRPVTHGEFGDLLEAGLTKFFGSKDPLLDDPEGAGVVDDTPTPALPSLRDVEEVAARVVREAIAKLKPKVDAKPTPTTAEVIDEKPAKESAPVEPVRSRWREKLWS